MIIYCMCVDPERGRYLAFFNEDPSKKVICDDLDAAVGRLVRENEGVTIDNVYEVETHD